jgi:hypothetical protein
LAAIARRSAAVPALGVYRVCPVRSASTPASTIGAGVSKSGSPAARPITSTPRSRMARAASVRAMVLDGRSAATAGLSVGSTAAAAGAPLPAAAAGMPLLVLLVPLLLLLRLLGLLLMRLEEAAGARDAAGARADGAHRGRGRASAGAAAVGALLSAPARSAIFRVVCAAKVEDEMIAEQVELDCSTAVCVMARAVEVAKQARDGGAGKHEKQTHALVRP